MKGMKVLMSTLAYIVGSIDIFISVVLVLIVLFQNGRSANLSGAISGGAETFFGKNKGRSIDAVLSKLTTAIAFVFVILTVVMNILLVSGKI